MTVEHRQIMFSRQELLFAVISFDAATALLPAGTIVDADIVERRGRATIAVKVSPNGDDAPMEVTLTPAAACSAIIAFCGQEGIPLPRAASKRLTRCGDGLALQLDLNAAGTPYLVA
jgi:hypothetical protein